MARTSRARAAAPQRAPATGPRNPSQRRHGAARTPTLPATRHRPHPDQWLRDNSERVVTGLAAAGELARREQREIGRQAKLAVTQPPAHVRELIGERPISGVQLAHEWERLAERIERHRLEYKLDLDKHAPLGPEPSQIARQQRHAYEGQRNQLASEIESHRETRRLPDHEQAREITHDRERDEGLERDP